jgi:WD40 repeat protein
MTQEKYELAGELQGQHEQDVKCLLSFSGEYLVSGSRDGSVLVWHSTPKGTFEPVKQYRGHSHFVNSLTFMRPTSSFPQGIQSK